LTLLFALLPLSAAAQPVIRPKLVLFVAVDQFRYDYVTRFRAKYKEGLDLLLTKGAVFTNAQLLHFPTVTAVGHSVFLSGAFPSVSGIIANDWYDRASGKSVTSVSDDTVSILGGRGGLGASPRRLLVSTIGDEMKAAYEGRPKVIGISLKDRGAILAAGHSADGAYWFDSKSGSFVSSTYYFPDLPGWVKSYNASRPADCYREAEWMGKKMPGEATEKLFSMLQSSPFGNELIEEFAERAVQSEALGQRDATDLLVLSFSSNDYVGHDAGPDAPEVREICLHTDRLLGKLFRFLDSRIGMRDVLAVLTSDHGVAPLPEANAARKMPGGRMPLGIVRQTVEKALAQKYGEGRWIVSPSEHSLTLNQDLIREKKLNEAEVHQAAAQAALEIPHVYRVYTREQLITGRFTPDEVSRRVMNGFHPVRSADVYLLLEPYWIFSARGTTHGTAFSYDAHVPLIFMGPGVRPGSFHDPTAVNDIAPTLATILGIETPSGSAGRVLSQILTER